MPSSIHNSQSSSIQLAPQIDFAELFNALPSAHIILLPNDPDFTIVAENDQHAKVAFSDKEKTIGKSIFESFPDTSEKFMESGISDLAESFRTVIRTKQPDSMEAIRYDLKGPDGKMATRYWRATHYPILNDHGDVAYILQATADITREIETGNQLDKTRQQLKDALSSGMVGTWTWDIGNDVVIGDSSMAVMFGVSTEEAAKGLSIAAFVDAMYPADRERVQKEIAAAMESGDRYYTEYRTLGKDGQIHWLIARGRIERDEAGRPVQFPGVLVDITDRKHAENNVACLADAGAILASSLDYRETVPRMVKIMIPDMADWCSVDLVTAEDQLDEVGLAHVPLSKARMATLKQLRSKPRNISESAAVGEVINSGKPILVPQITPDVLAQQANSDDVHTIADLGLTSVILAPIPLDGKTIGVLTLAISDSKLHYNETDLNLAVELGVRVGLAVRRANLYDEAQRELRERIKLEQQLREMNDLLEARVESRTHELNDSNMSLQRSNQELQDFAYVASHDLQEPLRKIQAFGNLLETEFAGDIGENGIDYLKRMRGAAARMSSLIEDLLAFSRVTTKGREFASVNLHTVVKEVIDDLEIRIVDTHATISIDDLPTIQADAMQMRQLMQNLIANALKFRREGVSPAIRISAQPVKDKDGKIRKCQIMVADNGLGFDEKYLDRIFAVFQRLHERDSFEGTGIGLAVCRKIVERHGGTITATSTLGVGSTFIVTLPKRHKKGEQLL